MEALLLDWRCVCCWESKHSTSSDTHSPEGDRLTRKKGNAMPSVLRGMSSQGAEPTGGGG